MHTSRKVPDFEIVDHEMAAVLRAKTGQERLAIAWGMWESARRMLTSHLSSEHPEWDGEQVQLEVARRLALDAG